jgi:serine/threonine protein kinase
VRQPVPFGKYLLLDRISVGGMAEVFKAKSYGVEGFEKIIAIKRILPTMGEDRDFIKMFIDEAKIAGQLAHANICQIFELGRIDGSHFIAMEYIWGKDLLQIQNRLRKLKMPMPVPMACFVIAKALEGLDYAHRKRDPLGRPLEIVHRDCSPQNVLVSYEGEVKVIDFGIAKATSRNSRTMAGVLKGKFGYMSPEQVRGLPLDRRSDIFALGTMLYECLTSERLFQGETDFSTLEKVRNVDIRTPRDVNPNIPEHIERVILRALAKDVDDRYQWCSEMLADIQQYLMSQDVVFTAKSLSGWLKDGFSPEIDRERQQLESYKRVGRDGLIQGVPAAEAKVDVVASLGEAGAPEGDATQLGGPSFEDLDVPTPVIAPAQANLAMSKAVLSAQANPGMANNGASKPVGHISLGAPGANNAISAAPTPVAPVVPPAAQSGMAARGLAPPPRARTSDDDDGFGEEAPTEIFGELDNASLATAAPTPIAVKKAPGSGPVKAPAGSAPPPMAAMPQGAAPPPVKRVARSEPGANQSSGRTPPPEVRGERAPNPTMPMPPNTQPPAPPMQPPMGGMGGVGGMAAPPAPQMLAMQQPSAMAGPDPGNGQGYNYNYNYAAPGGQPQHEMQYDPQAMAAGTPGMMASADAPQYDAYGQPLMAMGTPGSVPMVSSGLAPANQGPAKTLIGASGIGNYGYPQQPPPAGGYRPITQPGMQAPVPPASPSGQGPAMAPGNPSNPNMYGYQYDAYGQPIPMHPSQPQMQPYQMPMQGQQGYPSHQQMAYAMSGQPSQLLPAPAEEIVPMEGRKKSTLVRDIIIGILIAAVVLGGFLAVKMFVLDADDSTSGDDTATKIASVKIKLPEGVTAAVYIDDKKEPDFKAVVNGQPPLPIAAGKRKIRIEAVQGKCEREVDLAADATTELECPLGMATGSASGSAGSAAATGSNSGGSAAGSASASTTPSNTTVNGTGSATAATTTTTTTTTTTMTAGTGSAAETQPVRPRDTGKTVTPPTNPGTVVHKPSDTATPAVADKGFLVVTCKPPAKILVDGVATGLTTPITGHALPLTPGPHKVTFEIGADKYSFRVSVEAGKVSTLTKDFGQ